MGFLLTEVKITKHQGMSQTLGRIVHCPKCHVDFLIPDLPKEFREQVAALVRTQQKAEATRQLKIRGGVELRDGKGIVLHITNTKGACNRCNRPIAGDDETFCSSCNALNLNW